MLNSFYDKFIFTNGIKYKHNNFFMHQVPFLIVPVDMLVGVVANNNEEFQREIYYSVKESVQKQFTKRIKADIKWFENYFVASGWGKLETANINIKEKQAIISLTSNPFAQYVKKKPKYPADHIFRGVLAGLFSNAFGEDLECVEVKCEILGQGSCEFVLKKQEDFDFNNEVVRRQLRLNI